MENVVEESEKVEAEGVDVPAEATADPENLVETSAPDAVETELEPEVMDDPIAALKAEAEKNLDGWQRTLAEFQNYKRRVGREQQALWVKAALETLTGLLPIIDDFERALANIPEDLKGNAWVDGVALIEAKFIKLLSDHDIEVLDPVGEPFDPNRHQAIGAGQSDEHESGQVMQTLQKGYLSGDVVLRPAVVMVAG